MRTPSLTVETFVAALAVLGAAGCSKAAPGRAAPEPAPATAPAPAEAPGQAGAPPAASGAARDPAPNADVLPNTAATTTAAPQAPSPAQPNAAPSKKPSGKAGVGATPVDAGSQDEKKKVNASCGANGCTPDMKKGSGN